MASSSTSASVLKVLDGDNYLDWSHQMKNKLMADDLWEICETAGKSPKAEGDKPANKTKNDMALKMIKNSCGSRLRSAINLITSAEIAWDTLAAICKLPKSGYTVPEKENFEAWNCRMRKYLMTQDLWDIVDTTTEPPKPNDKIALNTWSKKNAIALYLIWESSKAFSSIGNCSTAKTAWDRLAKLLPSPKGSTMSFVSQQNSFVQYLSFQNDLRLGNWDAVNQFITSHPEAMSAKISTQESTALHIAIVAGQLNIVKKLVNIVPEESLKITDNDRITVLGCAAIVGDLEMAECIIAKSRVLLGIENGMEKLIPVVAAIAYNSNRIEMVRYLFSETHPDELRPEKGHNGATFITRCIYAKSFDMALELLERYPTLATALDVKKESPVFALACMTSAFPSGYRHKFWKQWIYNSMCIPPADSTNEIPISNQNLEKGKCGLLLRIGFREIHKLVSLHEQSNKLLRCMCNQLRGLSIQQLTDGGVLTAIIRASKKGVVEFVTAILRANPELVWCIEIPTSRNLFMCAVLHRQNKIFCLIHGFRVKSSALVQVDFHDNNILHMAAILEPSARPNNTPGAAFLMQREVQWFKEVKEIIHPFSLDAINNEGQTPQDLFTMSHKDLIDKGEKWMKETATSCTVAAALIVTIMFAAAITVPGGNDSSTGLPMFLNGKVFALFIIFDALSLLSSSTSLLMFLGILTSRYAEDDFLESLPRKMIIGLSTLIFSIATMMITFCASLFIILHGRLWVVIPVICLASLPVTLFAFTQLHLLIDMFISTYRPGIFDKNVKPWP